MEPMDPEHEILRCFEDLLGVARQSAPAGQDYEFQRQLIADFRSKRRPFLATMPLRHRCKCSECGMERGEAMLHFEDPSQPIAVSPNPGMWSVPVGAYADISRSKLHGVLVHRKPMPKELGDLIASVGQKVNR